MKDKIKTKYGKLYIIPLALICAILTANIISCNAREVNASEITITSLDDLKGATLTPKYTDIAYTTNLGELGEYYKIIAKMGIYDKEIYHIADDGTSTQMFFFGNYYDGLVGSYNGAYIKNFYKGTKYLFYSITGNSEQLMYKAPLTSFVQATGQVTIKIENNVALELYYQNTAETTSEENEYIKLKDFLETENIVNLYEKFVNYFLETINFLYKIEKETATINFIYNANGGEIIDDTTQLTSRELELTYDNAYQGDTFAITQEMAQNLLTEVQGRYANRDGYELVGWSLTPNGEVFSSETFNIQDDRLGIMLYAMWRATSTQVYVSYDANGGEWTNYSGATPTITAPFGTHSKNITITQQEVATMQEVEPYTPKRDGFIFKGWSLTPNGEVFSSETIELTEATQTIDVYAVWQEENYNVDLKIIINNDIVWQGQFTTITNLINGSINWSNINSNSIILEDINTSNIALVNSRYGGMTYRQGSTFEVFPMSLFSEDSYIKSIGFATPSGTITYLNTTQAETTLDIYDFFESGAKENYLRVDNDNYYLTISIEWSDGVIISGNDENFSGLKEIFQDMFDVAEQFLNIKIGFITIWNVIVLVLAITILGFIIKVWQGGNNG